MDCISRADARSLICEVDLKHHTFGMSRKAFKDLYNGMDELPSVPPQEPKIVPIAEIKYDENKLKELVNKVVLTVTPQEPRKGHWISHREHCENLGVIPSGLGAYEWCSECDCGIDVREWHRNNYNYCPNCGCRMVESQESGR